MNLFKLAEKWRESNSGNGESYVGKGGVVVFFDGQLQGWVNELRNPESWQPGSIAVDESENLFMAVGGNYYDGAESWSKLSPVISGTISKFHNSIRMQPLSNVMLDIETLGTSPDAAVLSIGAVFFNLDTGEIGNKFYRTISLESCISAGLSVDASTITWWMNQGDEAKSLFSDKDATSIEKALSDLTGFMKRHAADISNLQVWGNGPSFDNTIISNLYRKTGISRPWAYHNDRCVRTIVELGRKRGIDPKNTAAFNGTKHNALDDAIHQAKYVAEIYQLLTGGCHEKQAN